MIVKIQTELIHHIWHISVTGVFESDEDIEELLQGLDSIDVNTGKETNVNSVANVNSVHITFFDTRVLPLKIFEKLALMMNDRALKKNKANSKINESNSLFVKIYVLQRFLSSYLLKLGVRNTFVPSKTLREQNTFFIKAIAIGGSAESLEKIFTIVENLPSANISVFIVQHIKDDVPNLLGPLLKKRTSYNVLTPNKIIRIEENTIYVAPSGCHMKVSDGFIYLTKEPPVNYARPSIEILFESLSHEYRDGLLAIILSGYGKDGCKSLGLLKKNRSKIIVEDPDECIAKDLPKNCIDTGNFDHKFKMNQIVDFISGQLNRYKISDSDLERFLKNLYSIYGYDFRDYQKESIKRRINLVMIDEKFENFISFQMEILNNQELFKDLFLGFSINVTEFFRNPEVFRGIKENVFPNLKSYPYVKIWCAGCSTGEEIYSLAILLEEAGLLNKTQIYATDFNPYVLEEAKNGLYPAGIFNRLQNKYFIAGGVKKFENYFENRKQYVKINDSLKRNILFFQHSLVGSGVLNEFQLILCRNVLIYFNQSLQERVFKLFSDSLDISGFLILGDKEDINIGSGNRYFSICCRDTKIYRKIN